MWWRPRVEREDVTVAVSPPGCTREEAERWRRQFLEAKTVVGVRLEEVEDP